jgi:hypothetical protein
LEAAGAVSDAGVVGMLVFVPKSHFQSRTRAPSWGTSGTAATTTGAASGTGMGMMGAAEAGRMLGTRGASLCGFLSRLPMFESSMLGWSAS